MNNHVIPVLPLAGHFVTMDGRLHFCNTAFSKMSVAHDVRHFIGM